MHEIRRSAVHLHGRRPNPARAEAGASGYLLKDSAESDLVRAIRSVAEGKSFFSPAVSKLCWKTCEKLQRTGSEDSYDLLTPREREILQ